MTDLKNKHELVVDIMTQVATIATKLGIVHNNNEDEILDGRHLVIRGK